MAWLCGEGLVGVNAGGEGIPAVKLRAIDRGSQKCLGTNLAFQYPFIMEVNVENSSKRHIIH